MGNEQHHCWKWCKAESKWLLKSLMILYILCLNTNMLHQFRWLLFCGMCGFAFVVCVSFVEKMGVVYGATLSQSVVSIGKHRHGCNIWKF